MKTKEVTAQSPVSNHTYQWSISDRQVDNGRVSAGSLSGQQEMDNDVIAWGNDNQ